MREMTEKDKSWIVIVCLFIGPMFFLISGCEISSTDPRWTRVGGEMMCFYGEQLRKCSYSSIEKIVEKDIKPLD